MFCKRYDLLTFIIGDIDESLEMLVPGSLYHDYLQIMHVVKQGEDGKKEVAKLIGKFVEQHPSAHESK
jgi:hypothetical protein